MKFVHSLSILLVSLIALLNIISSVAHASDLDKEKRWADQIVETIFDGEAIWLNDGGSDFLAIYTEPEEHRARAVIVMHGTGIHPDWQQVVQPLRVGLTVYGWNTLSIQMPILENEATYQEYASLYDEVAPRIDAAIRYLYANGIKEIALLGHSQGSTMTAYYLSSSNQKLDTQILDKQKPDQQKPNRQKAAKRKVAGFVAIGMAGSAKDPRMDNINSLQHIRVPVLDLYGKEDLDSIITSANARAASAKKSGNNNYKQLVIAGDHFFDGNEDTLVETVAEWLSTISNL